MVKRTVVGFAWFMAVGWGLNLLAVFSGFPSWLSLSVAASIALFFAVDPLRVIWPAPVAAPNDVAEAEPETRSRGREPLAHTAL